MSWTSPPYPSPDDLRRRCQALAMLDAIVCDDWAGRYFSFNARWSEASQMAAARNGSGDDCFLLFKDGGCVFKQFLHELNPRLTLNEVLALADHASVTRPPLVAEFLGEPAFMAEDVSQLGWYSPDEARWIDIQPVSIPGTDSLLGMMMTISWSGYLEWAGEYFEIELPGAAVRAIFDGVPLSAELLASINPDAEFDTVLTEAEEIGYPVHAP